VPGLILDTGGLIAFERGDRRLDILLSHARATGQRVTVPATALAQAIRDPRRQARLTKLARHRMTVVAILDHSEAVHVGRLLAASGTTDITDAHVVLCAQHLGQRVVTSDPGDIRALDPLIQLIVV
jgi:hypothetical protein